MKKLTKKQMEINEQIAKDIIDFAKSIYCWEDICIFYNNKALSSEETWNVYNGEMISEPYKNEFDIVNGIYEYNNIDSPKAWTEYANENTVTVIFDGSFYEWINYYGDTSKLSAVLEKYNAYYEMGEAFNFSIYFN